MTTKLGQESIHYDPSGVFESQIGISSADLTELEPELRTARDNVFDDAQSFAAGVMKTDAKDPLDAGFIELPRRLLDEMAAAGPDSELGKIIACGNRIADQVDRVVLLGIGGSYMGARALMDGCCHSLHNELPRADRRHRPRIYFEGNNVDNDHSDQLLAWLNRNQPSDLMSDRWAIVVISKSGGTLETAVAFRQFLKSLRKACGDDPALLASSVVPVTGEDSKLAALADALKCPERFEVPDGVGGRFSILSAVGLIPAAIMGLDVEKLLRGAVDMTDRFRDADPGDNPVLDYVAVCRALETKKGIDQRVLSVWSKSLETTGLWYDQLLAESIGKDGQGALPLTVVNTRDLHSRAQQHQEGKRDKLMTNLIVDQWECDPLEVGMSDLDDDGLNQIGNKTLPEVMQAAIFGTNVAYQSDKRPTADIHLPRIDEYALGQFYQMMMLATVVEGELMKINPYGQPGVEAYKTHMKSNLGMK